MYTNPAEAAYCITRIARSQAHAGIAEAYGDRLTSLTCAAIPRLRSGETPVRSAIDA